MHLQHYLLCYDIADAKRLARVQRLVSTVMLQVQYSVYYAEILPSTMQQLVAQLAKIINPKRDDIRVYAVESLAQAVCLGSIRALKVTMFDSKGRAISN